MEMRNENNEKRRRKIIQREPVLVRSAKPGQTSIPAWERTSAPVVNLWKSNLRSA